MSEVIAACVGLAGVIVGVLLTWISGYFLKIQEAIIQREHAKFASYHEKQIQVLAELYKHLNQLYYNIDRIVKSVPSDPVSVKSAQDFKNESEEKTKEIVKQALSMRAYYRNFSIYLDDAFEAEIEKLFEELGTWLFHKTIGFPAIAGGENILETTKKMANYRASVTASADSIKDLMIKIKAEIKHVLRG